MDDMQAPYERGSGVTVWTLGHAHHPFDYYVQLLGKHNIERVVDVRSVPYAKHAPHFNRDDFEHALSKRDIGYLYLGAYLGQRPSEARFYDDDGHTLYEELVKERWFLKAIGQVEHEAAQQRLALTCIESKPEECHRYHLLGKVLAERGAAVVHIHRDGSLETQQDVGQRLNEGQGALFDDEEPQVWRSPTRMARGYRGESRGDEEPEWE
jgi:uncharacterized protein (DUF488 family)